MEILFFTLGLAIGSFLNVVSDRITNGESLFFSRSHCTFCQKTLNMFDLIPLISFLYLRGKCRYCRASLSLYYPAAEILTALVFALVYYKFGASSITLFYLLMVFSSFIVILLTDLKYRIIPDKIVWPTIAFVLIFSMGIRAYTIYVNYQALAHDALGKYLLRVGYLNGIISADIKDLWLTILSASLIFLFFWLLIFLTKGRGMGGGDMKLGLLVGLFNGFPYNVLAIFLGFLSGAVISVFLMALGKKTMKDTIPFGPFLLLGSVLAYLAGAKIVSWYIGLI